MEQFKIISVLYILSLLIILGFASSVQIALPVYGKYAYATALFLHSSFMFYVFLAIVKKAILKEGTES